MKTGRGMMRRGRARTNVAGITEYEVLRYGFGMDGIGRREGWGPLALWIAPESQINLDLYVVKY